MKSSAYEFTSSLSNWSKVDTKKVVEQGRGYARALRDPYCIVVSGGEREIVSTAGFRYPTVGR